MNSVYFRDIEDKKDIIAKLQNLEFSIPVTWWYDCINHSENNLSQCRIDIQSNIQPEDRVPPYFLQFYPKGNKIFPKVDESILKNIKKTPIKISDVQGIRTDGVIDPLKYTEGSSYYKQLDSISTVQLQTETGTFIFTGVVTQKDLQNNFNSILSTFKFTD